MNNAPIGILDSGFGGLSIYKSITALLPHESILYIGDHAHIPYSEKSPHYIQDRVIKLLHFFVSKNVKLAVIACNTATVAGIDVYRKTFPNLPIIGVVPVVKLAAELSQKKSFVVLSTNFTANSDYQKKLITSFASDCRVFNLGGHSLVDYVERGVTAGKDIEQELQKILTPSVLRDIDVIALGCTHYPFLKNAIRSVAGNKIRILDSGGAVARQVQRILLHNKIEIDSLTAKHSFYSTSKNESLSSVASMLIDEKITVSYANI